MKLDKKLIAVPAIALAAGLSLTACGSSSSSTGAGSSASGTTTPKATACAYWAQAKTESTTAEAQTDVQQAVNALGSSASAAGSNASLWQALSAAYTSASIGSQAGVSAYSETIDSDCAGPAAAPSAQAPAPADTTPAAPPTKAAPAPVSAQAPAPTQAPAAAVPASDAWSVAVAYTNDINAGDNSDAWNLLSSSVQNSGWGGSYSRYVADFTPLSYDNVTYSSSSGDSVTFVYTLHNHSTGSQRYTSCIFTVDDGVITSSS